MRISILANIFAFTTLSTAVSLDQSPPFALVVLSQNQTYNGTALIPCEKGKQGPFPGLCPLASISSGIYPVELFNLNYTSSSTADTTASTAGYLAYELLNRETGTEVSNVSAPMAFNNEGSYQVPIFGTVGLDGATKVSFNDQNLLGIPTNSNKLAPEYNQWYVCEITGALTPYQSVVWNSGDSAPQLDSCVKADIIRVFA